MEPTEHKARLITSLQDQWDAVKELLVQVESQASLEDIVGLFEQVHRQFESDGKGKLRPFEGLRNLLIRYATPEFDDDRVVADFRLKVIFHQHARLTWLQEDALDQDKVQEAVSVLKMIASLALRVEDLFPEQTLPLVVQGQSGCRKYTREQVA